MFYPTGAAHIQNLQKQRDTPVVILVYDGMKDSQWHLFQSFLAFAEHTQSNEVLYTSLDVSEETPKDLGSAGILYSPQVRIIYKGYLLDKQVGMMQSDELLEIISWTSSL